MTHSTIATDSESFHKAEKSSTADGCPSCIPENLATGSQAGPLRHPDHTSAIARLKKIKGQIIGIEKMISEQRYCVDILVQFRAVAAALNAVEISVFKKHIEHCVREAFQSEDKTKIDTKIFELTELVSKRL